MLQKIIRLAVTSALGALLLFPGSSSAGVVSTLTVAASTTTSITAGQTVTFSVSYVCGSTWTSASVQLFNDQTTMTTANKLGSATALTPPATPGTASTKSITLTFANAGTYAVNANVSDVVVSSSQYPSCYLQAAAAPVTVTVAAAPTTTTPATTTTTPATTTTTVAPTTTTAVTTTTVPVAVARKLPTTGSQPLTAVLAVSAIACGLTAIAVRKRRI